MAATDYQALYGDKYLQQLDLEIAYKEEAERLLLASLDKAISDNEGSKTKLGSKLIDVAYNTVKVNMLRLIDTASEPKGGAVAIYMPLLKHLVAVYSKRDCELVNLLTLSTLATTLNGVLRNRADISRLSKQNVSDIIDESYIIEFFNMKEEEEGKADIRLHTNMDESIKKRVQRSYKIQYATTRMHKEGFVKKEWDNKIKMALGAKLLEMLIVGSGYFEEATNGQGIACIVAKEWLANTWDKNKDLLVKYAHKWSPTLIKPKPWTTPYDGGYYGALSPYTSLLRLHGGMSSSFGKEYKERLSQVNLSYVYEALNAMQDTAYCINKPVLDIVTQILASGGGLGIPTTEPLPTLPPLREPYTEEELKAHKFKMVGIIKQNQARASKALRATMTIASARKFVDYEEIYFPWNMDYRGRCYPIPTAISPQGDDLAKALLAFANPSKCTHADAYKWLAIHGANLAGHDKVPFADRVAWVEKHTNDILSSANDPLGYTWWYEESQNDYPIEFISFCLEWKRLQEYLASHKNCVGFTSGIPIAFDGTCSGLQHFSALLRDEVGGQAVNLIPSDSVQDIYSIVADKVNIVLLKDAKSGTNDDYKLDKKGNYVLKDDKTVIKLGTRTLAQQWLTYGRQKFGIDGITRKVCKRSVMTLAYGSKQYGFKENLMQDIIKPFILDHPADHPFIVEREAAVYMATLIWDAVGSTVVKAVEGMEWLQNVAKEICNAKTVVTWTTPNGLPVQQNYFKMEQKAFKMRFNGIQKRFYSQTPTFDIDKKAQQQAIAPNFIHSMDACHLQRVVVSSKRSGNDNFAMIHDSFGTDIAHAGDLFKTIRAEFVGLYDNKNHFEDFIKDVEYLLPDDAEIPKIPAFGTLNIQDVAKSDFCFA